MSIKKIVHHLGVKLRFWMRYKAIRREQEAQQEAEAMVMGAEMPAPHPQ